MTTLLLQTLGNSLLEMAKEFLLLTLQVLPFLFIGVVTGAVLQTFLTHRWSERLFGGRGLRPLLVSVAAGALLPGCSCATMPMAAGLRGTAIPKLGTVAAFIFVSPLLSPITVILTWAMLGWQLTAARVVSSLLGGLLLGLIINRFEKRFIRNLPAKPTSLSVVAEKAACGLASCGPAGACCEPEESEGGAGVRLWRSSVTIFRTVTPYFLLGMLIAAAIFVFLPEGAIPAVLGGSTSVWAYGLAAVVGIPIYVCEGEEVPIAYALLAHGLGPGPTLTFLLGSVGTCIPTFLMSQRVIGRRTTVFSLAYWFVFVIGAGVLFQTIFGG